MLNFIRVNNVEIEETENIFSEIRKKDFQKSVINRIREKLYEIKKRSENEQGRRQHSKELKRILKS